MGFRKYSGDFGSGTGSCHPGDSRRVDVILKHGTQGRFVPDESLLLFSKLTFSLLSEVMAIEPSGRD